MLRSQNPISYSLVERLPVGAHHTSSNLGLLITNPRQGKAMWQTQRLEIHLLDRHMIHGLRKCSIGNAGKISYNWVRRKRREQATARNIGRVWGLERRADPPGGNARQEARA